MFTHPATPPQGGERFVTDNTQPRQLEAVRNRRINHGDGTNDVVRIRDAIRADLVSVHRIERAVFDQPWPYDAFESALSAPAFLVAQRADPVRDAGSDPIDGSGIVGYLVGDRTRTGGMGHVKDLAVRPDAQGAGLGRRLLRAGLERFLQDGVGRVKLEVRATNDRARSLYRSEGFETARRIPGYYRDGETAIVMSLDLGRWVRTER